MSEGEACCGNCYFFVPQWGNLCVRFPPPQQSTVLEDRWCGEYQPMPKEHKPMTEEELRYNKELHAAGVAAPPPEKPQTKKERLSSFGDLAGRLK